MGNLKPSELRIGNSVLNRGGERLEIDRFYGNKIESDIKNMPNKDPLTGIPIYYHPFTEEIQYCKPIPITKEKLLQLGFTKTEDNDYSLTVGRKTFLLSLADFGDTDFHVLYRCDIGIDFCSLVYIDYIHEIQNIVFDLTGEELTIR